ncbi:MAG: hypothetical protein MJZ11_08585 [Lachnospiraceae bacterium]|nr:hypothetical protein [Lachnospiraceae bacterium]
MNKAVFDIFIETLKEYDFRKFYESQRCEVVITVEGHPFKLKLWTESNRDDFVSHMALMYNDKKIASGEAGYAYYNIARNDLVENLENIKQFFDELY